MKSYHWRTGDDILTNPDTVPHYVASPLEKLVFLSHFKIKYLSLGNSRVRIKIEFAGLQM